MDMSILNQILMDGTVGGTVGLVVEIGIGAGMKRISDKQKARAKKLAAMKPPADGRCVKCGKVPDWRGLARHHKIRRSAGGTDEAENIIFVCGICHSLLHGIIEK